MKINKNRIIAGAAAIVLLTMLAYAGMSFSGGDTVIDSSAPRASFLPVHTPSEDSTDGAVISDKEMTCTLVVRCDTILNNMDKLDESKTALIPEDGVIFAKSGAVFYEGESVFDLFLREMKENKIHMEYESTPAYNSVYIKGINNIYGSDCGDLSGWMYMVNGSLPDCGCSEYKLQEGDRAEIVYTCDMGTDIGADMQR